MSGTEGEFTSYLIRIELVSVSDAEICKMPINTRRHMTNCTKEKYLDRDALLFKIYLHMRELFGDILGEILLGVATERWSIQYSVP